MFRLVIPRPVYDAMLAHAAAELPAECCGILAGRVEDGVGLVSGHYPLVNELASPTEYVSDAESMFAAWRAWRAAGTDVLAVYHSHPGSAPVPSRRDLERNYSEAVVNLIIGLAGDEPEVRGWWLTATDYHEAEFVIS
jgi:proteasome lid subunit RPN8/RPN11